MIKAISIYDEEDAKKVWPLIRGKIDKSEITALEVTHGVAEITDESLRTVDVIYDGTTEVRIRILNKAELEER